MGINLKRFAPWLAAVLVVLALGWREHTDRAQLVAAQAQLAELQTTFDAAKAQSGGHKLGALQPITFANDLASSTLVNQYVNSISGNAGGGGTVPISATPLQWAKGTTTPTLSQAAQTTDTATNNIVVGTQGPWASAATNKTPGKFIVSIPNDVGGVAANQGGLSVQYNSVNLVTIGQYSGTGYGAIWFAAASGAPSGTNWSLLSDGSATYISAPGAGGNIYLGTAATYYATMTSSLWKMGTGQATAQYQWDFANAAVQHFTTNATSATLIYDAQTADTATAAFNITGQGAYSAAVTNTSGGNVVIAGGAAKNTSTNQGIVQVASPLDAGYLRYSWPSDANQTLTTAQSANNYIRLFAGTITATRQLTIQRNPTAPGQIWIRNATGFAITVKWTGGTTVSVGNNVVSLIGADGAGNTEIIANGT